MNRVKKIRPTPSYRSRVRVPGERFLATTPRPTPEQFRRHEYWREIHNEMYTEYDGICMYCASWSPRSPVGANLLQTSIDHYIPKSEKPEWAYQWDNFRLCRAGLNTNKARTFYVMDPFGIQNGWFQIDFTTFRMTPSASAPPLAVNPIRVTIEVLRLNDDFYVEERLNATAMYVHNKMKRSDLKRLYPFLADQMDRQQFDRLLLTDLKNLLPKPV